MASLPNLARNRRLDQPRVPRVTSCNLCCFGDDYSRHSTIIRRFRCCFRRTMADEQGGGAHVQTLQALACGDVTLKSANASSETSRPRLHPIAQSHDWDGKGPRPADPSGWS